MKSTGEARELLMREQARLLKESDSEEAITTLRSIKRIAPESNYAREEYLPDTAARLARLRGMVEGRDLLVLVAERRRPIGRRQ